MLIGILSDSHGNLDLAIKALSHMGKIDMLIHAGDGYLEAIELSKLLEVQVYAVIGNCDWTKGPTEKVINIQNKKLFLTHGHRYNVKWGLNRLLNRAMELKVDVVVFGHTHVMLNSCREDIHFINPGSLVCPPPGKHGGYGIIDINDAGEIRIETHKLTGPNM